MTEKISIDGAYSPSEDVVAREIAGELIIVPLAAGVGNMEDELYTLNETGKDIWARLDGKKTVHDIVDELAAEYDATIPTLEADVTGLLEELLSRKMIVKKK